MEPGERSLEIETLTHRQRLEKVVAGQMPDRTPVVLWRHFPVDDQTPDRLAAATAAYQRSFDFDLIKVTPSSSFCLKDWGTQDTWKGEAEGTRNYTHHVIQTPEDWVRLPVLDPTVGHLGNQLRCLKMLVAEFSDQTPIIQSIFSPLAQAKNLVSSDLLSVHLRKYPELVEAGLKTITETTLRFLDEMVKTGVDGIFYAVQQAQYGLLSEDEFVHFGQKYDLQILAAVQSLWLNMIHLHGENVMFNLVSRYPAAIINWHDRHTQPDLAEAAASFPGVLCGGLSRLESLVLGTPEKIREEARQAYAATHGKKFILGTGCVVPVTAPYGNLLTARHCVNELGLP
jgi:uroporphyrinogen decarboxylase